MPQHEETRAVKSMLERNANGLHWNPKHPFSTPQINPPANIFTIPTSDSKPPTREKLLALEKEWDFHFKICISLYPTKLFHPYPTKKLT